MRIYSMTATFGKLEHETLKLEPGLNVIEAPNEWGKSTWCAFLVAMFYGVETRSHTTKHVLADKERYAPWSGSPVSGQIELCWQGQDITIQRRTKGRIPMGEFSAFETHTGLPVEQLTGENCGQLLLGVEKPVFLRSGFLRGSDLAVEQEESLRRRLNALVTTGDESATADDLAKKLKELKNRCRANRTTGLLPQAYERKAALERDLQTLQSLQRQCQTIQEQTGQLEEQRRQLRVHLQALDYQAGVEAGRKYADAVAARTAAAQKEAQCREAVEGLPPRQQLRRQLDTLLGLEQERERLQEAIAGLPAALPEQPLQLGCVEKAAADARRYQRERLFGILLLILAAAAAAGGFVLLDGAAYLLWAVGALCLMGGILLLIAAGKLMRQYGKQPTALWAENAAKLLRQQLQQQADALQRERLCARLLQLQQTLQQLTGEESPLACRQKLLQGLDAYAQLDAAGREHENAASLAAALQPGQTFPEAPGGEDVLRYSRQETAQLLSRCNQQLQQLQLRLGACQGQMTALGQQSALEQELENLNNRIEQLEDTYAALELAQNTLTQARADLQRRFAPQIVRKAQELFSGLTEGRYDQLAMETDLRLHIRAEGEDTLRSSLWRSEGTVDQLYLALRLAVASELTPEAPMILDDALVRFDNRRLKLAMELLRKEAQNRQIILFSCQSREKTACNREHSAL